MEHPPAHTVISMAVGNAIKMGTTLTIYAALCRETARPDHTADAIEPFNGVMATYPAGTECGNASRNSSA